MAPYKEVSFDQENCQFPRITIDQANQIWSCVSREVKELIRQDILEGTSAIVDPDRLICFKLIYSLLFPEQSQYNVMSTGDYLTLSKKLDGKPKTNIADQDYPLTHRCETVRHVNHMRLHRSSDLFLDSPPLTSFQLNSQLVSSDGGNTNADSFRARENQLSNLNVNGKTDVNLHPMASAQLAIHNSAERLIMCDISNQNTIATCTGMKEWTCGGHLRSIPGSSCQGASLEQTLLETLIAMGHSKGLNVARLLRQCSVASKIHNLLQLASDNLISENTTNPSTFFAADVICDATSVGSSRFQCHVDVHHRTVHFTRKKNTINFQVVVFSDSTLTSWNPGNTLSGFKYKTYIFDDNPLTNVTSFIINHNFADCTLLIALHFGTDDLHCLKRTTADILNGWFYLIKQIRSTASNVEIHVIPTASLVNRWAEARTKDLNHELAELCLANDISISHSQFECTVGLKGCRMSSHSCKLLTKELSRLALNI